MSGHSKWSQIKHKKAASDAKRGQVFSKLVREIIVATKLEGPNPDANPRLKRAVERARAFDFPKDNIERAIKRAGGADSEKLYEFLFGATFPGNVLLLIEGITDNKNRTLAEVKQLLNQHNAKLADPKSVLWNFEKVGMIEIIREDNPHKSEEEIELAIIDAGAQNFKNADGAWLVETGFNDLERVRLELEKWGLNTRGSGHEYKASTSISLSQDSRVLFESLLEKLTGHPDILEIYTNTY